MSISQRFEAIRIEIDDHEQCHDNTHMLRHHFGELRHEIAELETWRHRHPRRHHPDRHHRQRRRRHPHRHRHRPQRPQRHRQRRDLRRHAGQPRTQLQLTHRRAM